MCVAILYAMQELDSYDGMQPLLMSSTQGYQY